MPWLVSGLLVISALRATWSVPLQGDDFWLIFSIHSKDIGVWANSINFTSTWITHGTHFNPIGYFLDAALKGVMLASESTVASPSVLHHGTIVLCSLLTLVAASSLLRRLLLIASNVSVSAANLSVPVALGFLASVQLTALWANYDPLVTHPIYASLTTLVGFAYLSVGLRAVMAERPRRWTAVAAALGVAGFLVYEMFIVFVVALAGIVLLYRKRLAPRLWRTLLWPVGLPLASLVAARIFVASHETTSYAGTEISLGPDSIPAWVSSTYTSAPGSLWGKSSAFVDSGLVGPFSIAAALLGGVSFAVWVFVARRSAISAHAAHAAADVPAPSSGALGAMGPVALIGALAPLPFVLSGYWSQVLLNPGESYMHSLIPLWCWALLGAVIIVELTRRRLPAAVIGAIAVVLAIWIGVQTDVNRQLAAGLSANPRFAVDITAVLENRVPDSDLLRCASLEPVNAVGIDDDWDRWLNREYEERYDEPYCSSTS